VVILSLHEILHGVPDPTVPHRQAFLTALGVSDRTDWQEVAERMIATVEFVRREEESPARRAETRSKLIQIAKCADAINALTGDDAVIDALRILANDTPEPLNATAGCEHLAELARRARLAASAIPKRKGGDTLANVFGRPSAKLLCAAMVREAMKRLSKHGKAPGERNEKALAACGHLWRAAGGTPLPGDAGDDPNGGWIRHLRDMRSKGEAVSAILSAEDCFRDMHQRSG
jgi:hypothetical protein